MKKSIIIVPIIAVLLLSLFVGTGFTKRADVVLLDWSVSEDGTKLTFNTTSLSSVGYTRGFEEKGGGVKPHYLVFYSSFGGLPIGAKNEFALSLSEDDTEIYFNRAGGGYELVLQKNAETGEWARP